MTWSKYILAIVVLIATATCIADARTRGSESSTRSSTRSTARSTNSASNIICSSDDNCGLKSGTRQKLDNVDIGASFGDCKNKCMKVLGSRKSKKCNCYCSTCISVPDIPENENYECQDTLDKTCINEGGSKALIKSRTLRRIGIVNVNSEYCEDQCVEKLVRTRSRKTRTIKKRRRQCSCFCFYHQVCLSTEPPTVLTTTEVATTQSTSTIMIPITTAVTEAPTTIAETTTTTEAPPTTQVTIDETTPPTTFQPTTEQPTTEDEGDVTTTIEPSVTTTVTVVEPTSTSTAALPSTTVTVMPTPTPTPITTEMMTTTEATTTEATTTEATTTEATTTEATTTEATTTEGVTTANPLLMDEASGAA